MFFGQCVPHDGVTVMPYSVDAGVEEIVGFAGSLGAGGERCGYAFGFPDRHPHPFWVRAVFRMPLAGRRRPCGPRVGSGRGAWWFENWIVDASNAMM